MAAEYQLRTTGDVEIGSIDFGPAIISTQTTTQTVRIYNNGDAAAATLTIGAITFGLYYTGDTNANGQEAITEKWLEASGDGGTTWTPIGGDPTTPANVLSLTPPAAGAYVDVALRLNIPASISTAGMFCFVPILTYPVET